MVIGNGFVTNTKEEAIKRIEELCNESVKLIPLPLICESMSYYMTKTGSVFGIQKYKTFFLTKEKKIEKLYSMGPSFRYALGHHKEKQICLANALYCTFVLGYYDENLKLSFKDGNPYNTSLDNLSIKQEDKSPLVTSNMKRFTREYSSKFKDLVWYARSIGYPLVDWQEAEDIVSDAFYEVCRKENLDESIIGIWTQTVKYRSIDSFRNQGDNKKLYNKDGEEVFGRNDKGYEVDLLRTVKGKKRLMYINLWMNGYSSTEIAEMTNTTRSNVAGFNTRTIQTLRKYYLNKT